MYSSMVPVVDLVARTSAGGLSRSWARILPLERAGGPGAPFDPARAIAFAVRALYGAALGAGLVAWLRPDEAVAR